MKKKIKKFLVKGNICNQDNRKNAGITLVALVITIIILLILAGITISQLSGTGIFEKAKEAKEKWQNAQDYEQTEIAKYTNEIELYSSHRDISESDIRRIIQEEMEKVQITGIYDTIQISRNNEITNASAKGDTYDLNKSINDFKYLIIYGKDNDNQHHCSLCVDKSEYCIGSNGEVHLLGSHHNDSWSWDICFSFPTDKTIRIEENKNNGWPSGYIYLIKGVR